MTDNCDDLQYEKRLSVLKSQTELLKQAVCIQKTVQMAVYEKKWTDFEFAIRALEAVSLKIEALEKERLSFFHDTYQGAEPQGMGDASDLNFQEIKYDTGNFYAWAASLPVQEREFISACYRDLKMEAAKFRFAGIAFRTYLNEMDSVTRAFLDAVFPERRGKLYGRRGAIKNADMRRMVLDKQV
ncbi:MAG: hypothetical protein LBV68_00560 [Spirochaetaceae bacterium]|jgi:hypothetical protein|nr:hypothetical protein [Spirochaetaceae bacterium]